ncbi:hypothetical protein FGW37_05505 [Streptomyces rectiverticillatus]|uniref:hypothetical protein n=1 Tax=Streptomyces rectiverticillatus TaxID=173860 RepID=UPI0015C34D61|nr:hypothetical protein [Streptomyces rectiverticillatus]QLE71132.1 hypothetical protein FGW37_05505 [Streptomyces rectiverticillatus]
MSAKYTRDAVSTAVNAAADMVRDELSAGERDIDLINMIVNATLTLLDRPNVSLDGVIGENYDTSPEEVRSWWNSWS